MKTTTIRHFLLAMLASCLSLFAQAQAPAAMVLSVEGDVSVEVLGKPAKLDAFTRLLEGDRVKLGKSAKLSLIYTRSSRQESWVGPGAILAGSAESTTVNGQPQVEVKQLPAKVAQMMAHTPSADSTGKAGMVRLRAIKSESSLAKLEQDYQQLKLERAPASLTPEIFYLAGLFEHGEYEQVRNLISELLASAPENTQIQRLHLLYNDALARKTTQQ